MCDAAALAGGGVGVEAGGGHAAADLEEALELVDLRHATHEENERLRLQDERKRKVIMFDDDDGDDDNGDGDDGDDDGDGDGDDDDGGDGGVAGTSRTCSTCGVALSSALLLSSPRSRRLCETCGEHFMRGVVKLHSHPRSDGFYTEAVAEQQRKRARGVKHINRNKHKVTFMQGKRPAKSKSRGNGKRRRPENRM